MAEGAAELIGMNRPRVLCVDDEPQILEGLSLHLRRHCDLETATSGAGGLAILERDPSIAVVISDMRMPGMDGAAFLSRAREVAPDAVRLLLTGQADVEGAIAVVNEGGIFRFLTKPCPPATLLAAVEAAVRQHRLVTAERVLLQQTLLGSVQALTDVLALISPAAFGRTMRIKQLVSELVEALGVTEKWQVEVAAMLSQLGAITLPPETAERAYYGRPLHFEEQKLVANLPSLTEKLLGNIPRLEAVREILRLYAKPRLPEVPEEAETRAHVVALGAQVLRVAVDFDALESSGSLPELSVATMRGREGSYDRRVMDALVELRGGTDASDVRELPMSGLRVGMILAEDVELQSGALLVARGYEITERFLERIRNFPVTSLKRSNVRVIVPARSLRQTHP